MQLRLWPNVQTIYKSINPCPAGDGGLKRPPCPFPSIAKKRKGIELRNFLNLFLHQFYTCWQGCGVGVGAGVGVGCFSRSRSRSRQNLPTPTDSGQALTPDSQKSPCRLFRPFFAHIFVVDWLDDRYRTKPCDVLQVEMAIGRNSGPRPNPVPISEMCHFVLDAVLALFAIAFEHLTQVFEQ